MVGWVLRRLGQVVLLVLVMSVIVFAALSILPTPADTMSQDATAEMRDKLIRDLGLDLPLWKQYLEFLWNVVRHGNLGNSWTKSSPVVGLIADRLPATIELSVCAMILAAVVGLPLGLLAGLYPERWFSKLIMGGSTLGFSLPSFWVGMMMIFVFAVNFKWLNAGDRGHTVAVFGIQWSVFTLDGLKHLLMPALNLAFANIALLIRLVRAGVRENMLLDYVKFARAKGISPARIVFVHVLRNIAPPTITVIGLEFGSILAFSVVTESVFSWPGMGKEILDALKMGDRPFIVAYLMMIVVIVVIINTLVDLFYMMLDPRMRKQA